VEPGGISERGGVGTRSFYGDPRIPNQPPKKPMNMNLLILMEVEAAAINEDTCRHF